MRIADLNPNEENPRTITKMQKKRLKKSMDQFGDLSGIVFNRQTKRLVGGHQRTSMLPPELTISIENQYEVPTRTGTVAEGYIEHDGEKLKYREVDWDETTEKMANLAANKHGGTWETDKLKKWMDDLSSLNVDMDLTGFDAKERDELMASETDEGANDDDEASEGPQEFIVAVYCDDETEMEEFFNESKKRGYKCKIIA